jgi:hypothetical protein
MNEVAAAPKWMTWVGWFLTILPAGLFIVFGVMGVINPKMSSEGLVQYGYPENVATPLAIIQVVCGLLYIIPQTTVLGVILYTAYLGGAVATHVRAGESSWYMAVIFGVVVWAGIWLRCGRVRALIPIRKRAE